MSIIKTTKISNETFDTIVQISDIHIRPLQRHEEFELVFEQFYMLLDKLKKSNTKAIVVCTGDVFESTTTFSSELYNVCNKFFDEITKRYSLILIAGNHDIISENRLDSLTPSTFQRRNLHYLIKSGAYEYGNAVFVVNSLYDKKTPFIKRDQIETDKLTIALYHGIIIGSKNDDGHIINNSNGRTQKVSDFNNYDLVCLGDIHCCQEVRKNAWYSGSMIQQNYGEHQTGHGCLIWNIKNKDNILVQFHELQNIYNHIIISIKDDIWTNPEIQFPKKSFIRLDITNTIETIKNKIIDEIKTKTEILDIYTVSKDKIMPTTIVTTTKDNVTTTEDVMLRELRILDKEPSLKEKLIELHKNYYAIIPKNENENQSYLWYPIKLEFKNMFGYAKSFINKIDFKNGVTSITAPNASGKSSIINILFYTIFNELLLNPGRTKHVDIINNKEKEAYVKLEIQYGIKVYTIEKTIKRREGINPIDIHNKISYMDNNKQIVKEQKLATDMMKLMFGNNTDFYRLNVLNNRDQTNDFFRMTDTEKIMYLKQSFNLNYFDDLVEINKKEIMLHKNIVKTLTTKKEVFNEEYTKLINNDPNYEQIADKEINKLYNTQKVIEKELKLISSEYDELNKQKIIKENSVIKITNSNILYYQKENDSIKKKHNDLSVIFDLNKLNTDATIKKSKIVKTMNKSIDELNNKITEINDELITLKSVQVKEPKEDIYKMIIKYETEKQQYTKEITKLQNELDNYNEKELTETTKTIDELLMEIKETTKQYQNKPSISKQSLTTKLNAIKKKLVDYANIEQNDNIEELITERTIIKKNLDDLINDINTITNMLTKLEKTTESCNLKNYLVKINNLKNGIKQLYPEPKKIKVNIKQHEKNIEEYKALENSINESLKNTFTNENIDEYITQIDVLLEKDRIVTKEYNNVKTNLFIPLKTILNEVKNNTIEKYREQLKEITANKNSLLNAINKTNDLIKENKRIDTIISENIKINEQNNKINTEIMNYEYHYNTNKLKSLNDEKIKLEDRLSNINKIYEYGNLTNEMDNYTKQINIYKQNEILDMKIAELTQERNYIEYNKVKEYITMKEKEMKILEVKLKKIKQQYRIIVLKEEKVVIENEIKNIQNNDLIMKEINEINKNIEYEKSRQKYIENVNTISSIKKNGVLELEIKELTIRLGELKSKEETTQKSKLDIILKINKYTESLKRITEINTEKDKISKDVVNNENKLKLLEEYGLLIGPKYLQTTIIRRELNKIETSMNEMIRKYTKYTVSMSYKNDTGIDIKVTTDNAVLTVERLSTYETLILTTAFKRSLGKHSNRTHSKLYIIDECMENMDSANFDTVLPELMKLIQESYSQILIVSQRDIGHISDNIITINKENDVSKIM